MAKGRIERPSQAQEQPDLATTRKSQKRYTQSGEYDPETVNSEFDWIHERLNEIVTEAPAIADLPMLSPLDDIIKRLNYLTQIMRDAGLLRPN